MANINESKKYHFIYKTTSLLDGKYYVGMHSTSNLKDGYLGSGTRLRRAMRKYGKENFQIEILEFFDSREKVVQREKELVNEVLLQDPMCMNLKPGGTGGFCNEEHAYKYHAAGGKKVKQLLGKRHQERLKSDTEYRNRWLQRCREGLKNLPTKYREGKKHSPDTIQKMKQARKGKGLGAANSQYGSFWVTDGISNRKLSYLETIPEGWYRGRVVH